MKTISTNCPLNSQVEAIILNHSVLASTCLPHSDSLSSVPLAVFSNGFLFLIYRSSSLGTQPFGIKSSLSESWAAKVWPRGAHDTSRKKPGMWPSSHLSCSKLEGGQPRASLWVHTLAGTTLTACTPEDKKTLNGLHPENEEAEKQTPTR